MYKYRVLKKLMRFFVLNLLVLIFGVGFVFAQDFNSTKIYDEKIDGVVVVQELNKDNKTHSICAGSIISKDGLILTAKHCAETSEVLITLPNLNKYKGQVIYIDDKYKYDGLAVIKIEPEENLTVIPFAHEASIGEDVVAIGHPFGKTWTVTKGVVSRIVMREFSIQTDAAINSGNSGGPILNSKGEIIAVVVFLLNPEGKVNIGLNYGYIPVKVERFLLEHSLIQ